MARTATARLATAMLAAITLGACALVPTATDPAAAHERALAVLSAWTDAVAKAGEHAAVTPVGELTGQIGDWEEAVGDNNKRALMAGMVASASPLSELAPRQGEVTWQDGTTTKVPLLSAQDALVAIESTTEAPCSDCTVLLATAAELTSAPIQTSRGPATAPVWVFTLEGTTVKVTRVAIANPIVVTPDDGGWGLGLAIDSASGSVSGTELTVAFVGAPDPGDKPCGEDYTADAVESDLAVVVIVTRHPHVALLGEACSAVGARRTATATLATPLGDRVVLDLQQGTPVPVVLAP
ncbi:MAG: hypothetical protein ACRDGI_00860 [Candidatus Limnocylindrales bacterium]